MTINTPNSGVDYNICVDTEQPSPCVSTSPRYVSARSHHPGGVMTLFGDGSVHFISDSIDLATWRALGTMSAGEVISGGF